MPNKEAVRDWRGVILGYIETDGAGNKTVRDFYNRILGYYKKDRNVTTDFYGHILAKGDVAASLIPLK
jgi:hypothetical protein